MTGSVIVGSARTPIGKLSGAFAGLSATDLGGIAIKRALERAGIGAEQIDYVLMGQVLQAGAGQITARQAAGKRRVGSHSFRRSGMYRFHFTGVTASGVPLLELIQPDAVSLHR